MGYSAQLASSRLWAGSTLQYRLNQCNTIQVRCSRIVWLPRMFLLGVTAVGGDSSRPSVSDSSVDGFSHFFIIPEIVKIAGSNFPILVYCYSMFSRDPRLDSGVGLRARKRHMPSLLHFCLPLRSYKGKLELCLESGDWVNLPPGSKHSCSFEARGFVRPRTSPVRFRQRRASLKGHRSRRSSISFTMQTPLRIAGTV